MNSGMPPVGSLNNKRGAGSSNVPAPTEKKKRPEHQNAVVKAKTGEKKSLAKKFNETFVKDDLKHVGMTLLTEKIFPDVISMIRDAIWDGISMHFGLGGFRGSSNQSRNGYTNYSTAGTSGPTYSYKSSNSGNSMSNTQPQKSKPAAPANWRDIYYDTEGDATEVLGIMRRNAKEYDGYSEVADLIEFSGFTANGFTDHNWGWSIEMLDSAVINRRFIDGQIRYFIDFPDPVSLKN